jgi:hypothetical protein
MLFNESHWIGQALSSMDPAELSPLINLGSSTEIFRTRIQPHIDQNILAPLRARQVRLIHSDISDGDGIDITGSIYDAAVMQRLLEKNPRSVLCSNMFEHVTDRNALADSLTRMVPSCGILIVTVPHSFPYHPDPIDSYYRPTPGEIHAMFPEFDIVRGEIVECGTLLDRYRGSRSFMVSQILGSAIPYPPRKWLRSMHHWCWMFRSYKVSCVILRKR